jgi:hypothetical protein
VGTRIAGLPLAARADVSSLGAALRTARQLPGPTADVLARAARQSYVHAFDLTLVVAVVVAMLASGLVAWLLRPGLTVEFEDEPAVAYEPA